MWFFREGHLGTKPAAPILLLSSLTQPLVLLSPSDFCLSLGRVYLVFERWWFALSLARWDGGSVSWVVE